MSHDGADMPDDVLYNVLRVAENLQTLRDEIGVTIHVNSGYRSKAHNKAVGGKPKSMHVLGKAADITAEGVTPENLYNIIECLIEDGKMEQGGLGLYNTFVHYDRRQTRVRWNLADDK